MAADKKSSDSKSNSTGDKGKDQTALKTPVTIPEEKTLVETAVQVTPIELELAQGVDAVGNHDEATTRHSVSVSIDSNKEEILEAMQELTDKFSKLEEIINNLKKGIAAQVLSLTLKGDNIHSDIHDKTDGLLFKMAQMQNDIDVTQQANKLIAEKQDRLTTMLKENKRLARDLVTTQGLLQKYSQKIKVLEKKVLDLTRRGMEQNLIFHAVDEVKDEDCYRTIQQFVQKHFQFEIDDTDVWKAYRLGVPRQNKSRPIFTKLSYYARDRIMDNVGDLKNKKNSLGQTLFISEQIPDGITEQRKLLGKVAFNAKKIEEKKPIDQQRPVKILGDKVVVGGEVLKAEVQMPQPMDLFPSAEEQQKIHNQARLIKEATPIYSYNSTFVGLAAEVSSVQEINLTYKAVMQRFPYMDHVMMAYQLESLEDKIVKYSSCDDEEYGGGAALSKFLYDNKIRNIAVFVVHRYGGIHLGMDRFNMIEKAAKQAVKILRPSTPESPPLEH